MSPTEGTLWQLENGTVVRVIGEDRDGFDLRSQSDGTAFRVKREPFLADIEAGYIQRVKIAGYTPVSDG